ncbi:MAG: hypothetical protein NVSMB31_06360 [Vulcanimicrobiaceae bacterium]
MARQQDGLYKLSINLPDDVAERLRRTAFEHELSESSIVEVALKELFAHAPPTKHLGEFLKKRGANLRRAKRT